jgi:hypothetical protein
MDQVGQVAGRAVITIWPKRIVLRPYRSATRKWLKKGPPTNRTRQAFLATPPSDANRSTGNLPLTIDRSRARSCLSIVKGVNMGKPTDLVQGTLDLLILKTVALVPMHGWGIAQRIRQVSKEAAAAVNHGQNERISTQLVAGWKVDLLLLIANRNHGNLEDSECRWPRTSGHEARWRGGVRVCGRQGPLLFGWSIRVERERATADTSRGRKRKAHIGSAVSE